MVAETGLHLDELRSRERETPTPHWLCLSCFCLAYDPSPLGSATDLQGRFPLLRLNVVEDCLDRLTLLLSPPRFWDYRHSMSCQVSAVIRIKLLAGDEPRALHLLAKHSLS